MFQQSQEPFTICSHLGFENFCFAQPGIFHGSPQHSRLMKATWSTPIFNYLSFHIPSNYIWKLNIRDPKLGWGKPSKVVCSNQEFPFWCNTVNILSKHKHKACNHFKTSVCWVATGIPGQKRWQHHLIGSLCKKKEM